MPQRCICGKSKTYPICDGSHESERWTCAEPVQWSPVACCSSFAYQNLARKLASHYAAVLCLTPSHPIVSKASSNQVGTLVSVVDGVDLSFVVQANEAASCDRRIVFSIGVSPHVFAHMFPEGSVLVDVSCNGDNPSLLFNQIVAMVDRVEEFVQAGEPGTCTVVECGAGREDGVLSVHSSHSKLHSAFISHAVADEKEIAPVLEGLRSVYNASMFVCADSIPPGSDWQQTIMEALAEKDMFVFILSSASRASQFCAFEIGCAYGMGKPMRIISLDGSLPPAFIQHLHMLDVKRTSKSQPWLSTGDVLMSHLLLALSGASDGAAPGESMPSVASSSDEAAEHTSMSERLATLREYSSMFDGSTSGDPRWITILVSIGTLVVLAFGMLYSATF